MMRTQQKTSDADLLQLPDIDGLVRDIKGQETVSTTLFLDCSQQYDYRTRKGDRKACLIDAEIIETLKACDINKMSITTLVNSILRAFIIQNQDILRQHLNKRNTLL